MPIFPNQHDNQIYSDSVFTNLSEQFAIPKDQQTEVREGLADIAAIWRWGRSQTEHSRHPSRDKKALETVIKRTQKLQLALSRLSHDANAALRQTDFQPEMQAIVSDNKYSDAGHKFYRYTNQDGVETILIDRVEDLIRSVSVLENVASEAKEGIRPVPDGRRNDYALNLWISNIADMWTDQLGRPFTRDATESGDPLTEAAQFCIAAFAPIEPSTSPTRILNEMRKHNSQSRKKSTGKNRVKNEP
jgi:hypothetical protein